MKGRKKRGPKSKKAKVLSPPRRRRATLRASTSRPGDAEDDAAEPEEKKDRGSVAKASRAKATSPKAKPKAVDTTPKASAKRKAKAENDSDPKPKASAKGKTEAKGDSDAKPKASAKKKGKASDDFDMGPLAKGAHRISAAKAAEMRPAELELGEALNYYFDVKDVAGIRKIIVAFGKKWASGENGPEYKQDMKADLDALDHCYFNLYWTRPATGLLLKIDGKEKELGYFSAPPSRSANVPWGAKTAVTAKAAAMYGFYVEWLMRDGYVDEASLGTSKDLGIMCNVLKSAMADALKQLAS